MDLEIIIPSKVGQKEKTNIIYHLYVEYKLWHKWTYQWKQKHNTFEYHLYMESKNMTQMSLSAK